MTVNIVCRNHTADRVIPRFARYLAERLGWNLTAKPDLSPPHAYYLSGYFEAQLLPPTWPARPIAAYFTHREEQPPGNAKGKLFDGVAERVQLRVATAPMYAALLEPFGATVRIKPPVELERFVIPAPGRGAELVAGFSGYTYGNGRKGEDLAKALVGAPLGQSLAWRASGRGWPVRTDKLTWAEMPGFYQSLDILVCTSLVEGVPMPPLEALACGVSVVIPRGVGLLDELGQGEELPGIHRYDRGHAGSLGQALRAAVEMRPVADPEALRAVVESYTVWSWCARHEEAIAAMMDGEMDGMDGMDGVDAAGEVIRERVRREARGERGIYTVAFGEPARAAACDLIRTARTHMPDVPVAVCAAEPLGLEEVFIQREDTDIGAREAKLLMYELAPAEWDTVLYMDADIEVVAPVYPYFEWVEDGWDLVATKDPHLVDTMDSYARPNNAQDMAAIRRAIGTTNALQVAGGVLCFARNDRVKAFFDAWLDEWRVHKQRDQGPLIRALYQHPVKLFLLGNEWNTFLRYMKRERTAGLIHYPGKARRWRGLVPGPLDGAAAWQAVQRFEGRRRGR